MQAAAPHLSQCCFRIEVQKSHTKRLKLGPLFSYKRLNCKFWSFRVENNVKIWEKSTDRCPLEQLSFLGHLLTVMAQKSIHRWYRR